ncbi:MAG: hypothetical protein ACREDK_05300 [Thermoplasmata archaeon]
MIESGNGFAPVPAAELPPSIPSLARRLVVGAIRLAVAVIVLIGVPLEAIGWAAAHGVSTSIAPTTVASVGVALAVLGAVRSIARPTGAFGPISMMTSAVAVLYLWSLSMVAEASVTLGGHGSLTFGFGELLRLLVIVPGIGILAAAVTTIEDLAHPGERVRIDYPPRAVPPS